MGRHLVSLEEFLQSLTSAGAVPATGTSVSSPRPVAGAAASLAEALLLAGAPAEEFRAAIVVGAADAKTLASLLDACPNAMVLLIAVEPTLIAALETEETGLDRGRCFVATLPEKVEGGFPLAVLSEMLAFLVDAECAPSDVLVLGASGEHAPESAAIVGERAVRDLCGGYSRALLANAVDSPPDDAAAILPLLRVVGDFLFGVREHYHALKYYWTLYHAAKTASQVDQHAGWRILECWAELGCPEWVDRWVDEPPFSDDFRAKIREEVGSELTRGRQQRAATFAKNRAALERVGVPNGLVAPTERNIAQVFLPSVPAQLGYDGTTFAVTRAEYPLLVRVSGPVLEELNPPPDPACFRAVFAALASRDQPHAVVVGWVRHAWAARILVTARVVSTLPGWRRLVFLIESDTEALAMLLATEDLSKPLVEATRAFIGAGAEDGFLDWLQTEPNVPPPGEFIGTSTSYADRVRGTNRLRIEAALVNRQRLDAVINRQSLGETLAVLEDLARGKPTRPLRVLIATSLYSDVVQYAAIDLADALKRLGHEVCLVRESQPGEMIHYQALTARTLEFRPDFAFLLNHLRSEAKAFHPEHLPFVTWIQDELPALKDKAMIAELGPLDFSYGFSVAIRDIYRGLGYPHVGHLPFAISGEGLEDEIPTEPRNEVVFPTHVTKPVEPPFVRGLGDFIEKRFERKRLIAVSMEPLSRVLDEANEKLNFAPMSPSDRQQAVFYALMYARRMDRIRIADAFLNNNLPIAVYGKGWDEIPRFAPHHRGMVPGGAPLRKVLREHKVVLHRGYNMHPRLLEGFAVGTFVLSQYADTDTQPGEICDQFEVGREICLFKDPAEMVALTQRALTDEPWRREVIAAARARIKANHTYVSRARTIIEDLRTGIARYLASGS
jgi:hypothetical protein